MQRYINGLTDIAVLHLTWREELHLNHEEHKKMAEAVLQRNFAVARDLMTYHILGALEEVITTLKNNNVL